jgi:hypothetical protein
VDFGFLRQVSLIWDFIARGVSRKRSLALHPTPNLEGQSPEFITPCGRVT